MDEEKLAALIAAELKNDIVGMVSREGKRVTISFPDGTTRTITVA